MTSRSHPQRLAPPSAPGTLFKALRVSAKRGRPPRHPNHLRAVRCLPCLKCGMEPAAEAHHARGGRQTMGRRQPDFCCVPLCPSCHRIDQDALHRVGELPFWQTVGIDPGKVAAELFRATGDVAAMRAVCLMAIAERAG